MGQNFGLDFGVVPRSPKELSLREIQNPSGIGWSGSLTLQARPKRVKMVIHRKNFAIGLGLLLPVPSTGSLPANEIQSKGNVAQQVADLVDCRPQRKP